MNTQDMIQAITDKLNSDSTALRTIILNGVITSLSSMSDDQLQNLMTLLGLS